MKYLKHSSKMKNILPTLALSLALASCTDTCLDSGSGQGNQADPTAQAHHLSTSQVLLCLLGTTADVDSLPDDWATTNFQAEPTLGIASSEANPYERLVVVPNATEACRLYKAMTSSPFTGEAQSSTWTRDSIGTLTFNVENQTDLYATLDVDVKQLPHLRQLRFVPQSVLGQNAETNYYTVGDVILQQNPDEAPTYYMCVCAPP